MKIQNRQDVEYMCQRISWKPKLEDDRDDAWPLGGAEAKRPSFDNSDVGLREQSRDSTMSK